MFRVIDVDSGTSVWETAQLRKFALSYHSGQTQKLIVERKALWTSAFLSANFQDLTMVDNMKTSVSSSRLKPRTKTSSAY